MEDGFTQENTEIFFRLSHLSEGSQRFALWLLDGTEFEQFFFPDCTLENLLKENEIPFHLLDIKELKNGSFFQAICENLEDFFLSTEKKIKSNYWNRCTEIFLQNRPKGDKAPIIFLDHSGKTSWPEERFQTELYLLIRFLDTHEIPGVFVLILDRDNITSLSNNLSNRIDLRLN